MLFEYMMYMAWTICGATTSTTLRRCRLPKGLNHRLHGWRERSRACVEELVEHARERGACGSVPRGRS